MGQNRKVKLNEPHVKLTAIPLQNFVMYTPSYLIINTYQ